MNIIVNSKSHTLEQPSISYEDLVRLAGESGTPTVVYFVKLGPNTDRNGCLAPNSVLDLAEGMRINCVHTGNA